MSAVGYLPKMTHGLPDLHSSALGSTVSGFCPSCQRLTTLTIIHHSKLDGSGERDEDGTQRIRVLVSLLCSWCKHDSAYIRHAVYSKVTSPNGNRREVFSTISLEQVWPPRTPRELGPEAPAVVREVFDEAALAEAAGAYRLAGIGYRATVEQIVKNRGAAGRDLKQRILALAATGVPQDILDAFNEARFVGNDAAHDALAYSAEEIADIAELIHEAVVVIYVQPAQRAKMALQRAARRASSKQASSP